MGVEMRMREIGVKFRKFTIVLIKSCYRSGRAHPIIVSMVILLIILNRSFPSLVSFLVSSSPVLVCTAVLLGTLLSYGHPDIPEVEKEEVTTTQEAVALKTIFSGDTVVVQRDEGFLVETFNGEGRDLEGKFVEEEGDDDDGNSIRLVENSREIQSYNMPIDETKCGDGMDDFELEVNLKRGENRYSLIHEVADEDEETGKDMSQLAPSSSWKRAENERDDDDDDVEEDDDDEEDSDSASDHAESSSPDASMADIIPMLDELHPLLDIDAPEAAQIHHDESDATSEQSNQDSENREEMGDDENDDDDDDEEEEEIKGGKDGEMMSAITWTEDDEKNLIDLGSSELERNQRLENLIARRRSRKIIIEKNMIDIDSDLPFSIPPISTKWQNPFDLPFDKDDLGLPPIPGSAPSILQPRNKNPFDLPYDSSEEKPDLLGDSFQQEFMPLTKGTIFRRHESFNVGPSIFAPPRQPRHDARFRPYFVPEQLVSESTSYSSSFQRQSSELSDSKVSSIPETDSTYSATDHEEDKKLSEEEDFLEESKNLVEEPILELDQAEREAIAPIVEIRLGDTESHHEVKFLDRKVSSLSSLTELSEKRLNEEIQLKDEPVYDLSPSTVNKNLLFSSVASIVPAEVSDQSLPSELIKIMVPLERSGSSSSSQGIESDNDIDDGGLKTNGVDFQLDHDPSYGNDDDTQIAANDSPVYTSKQFEPEQSRAVNTEIKEPTLFTGELESSDHHQETLELSESSISQNLDESDNHQCNREIDPTTLSVESKLLKTGSSSLSGDVDDIIEGIDEELLAELDRVGDFSVGKTDEDIISSMPRIEARSLEEINEAFTEILGDETKKSEHYESVTETHEVTRAEISSHLIYGTQDANDQKSTLPEDTPVTEKQPNETDIESKTLEEASETDIDELTLVEASSVEDIKLALEGDSGQKILEHTLMVVKSSVDDEASKTEDGKAGIVEELPLVEARSIEDINLALESIGEQKLPEKISDLKETGKTDGSQVDSEQSLLVEDTGLHSLLEHSVAAPEASAECYNSESNGNSSLKENFIETEVSETVLDKEANPLLETVDEAHIVKTRSIEDIGLALEGNDQQSLLEHSLAASDPVPEGNNGENQLSDGTSSMKEETVETKASKIVTVESPLVEARSIEDTGLALEGNDQQSLLEHSLAALDPVPEGNNGEKQLSDGTSSPKEETVETKASEIETVESPLVEARSIEDTGLALDGNDQQSLLEHSLAALDPVPEGNNGEKQLSDGTSSPKEETVETKASEIETVNESPLVEARSIEDTGLTLEGNIQQNLLEHSFEAPEPTSEGNNGEKKFSDGNPSLNEEASEGGLEQFYQTVLEKEANPLLETVNESPLVEARSIEDTGLALEGSDQQNLLKHSLAAPEPTPEGNPSLNEESIETEANESGTEMVFEKDAHPLLETVNESPLVETRSVDDTGLALEGNGQQNLLEHSLAATEPTPKGKNGEKQLSDGNPGLNEEAIETKEASEKEKTVLEKEANLVLKTVNELPLVETRSIEDFGLALKGNDEHNLLELSLAASEPAPEDNNGVKQLSDGNSILKEETIETKAIGIEREANPLIEKIIESSPLDVDDINIASKISNDSIAVDSLTKLSDEDEKVNTITIQERASENESSLAKETDVTSHESKDLDDAAKLVKIKGKKVKETDGSSSSSSSSSSDSD